ncbi:MAG: hypothetical protein L6R41_006320 [Letrouitia leprolyta]|nr:MAG: hypothetical protein L6R41_006320 [Letrouitia leprolyta]
MAARIPLDGGDTNRANEVYAFTWTLLTTSVVCVIGRMYTRIRLTRNVWWDDWCICAALIITFIISAMWTAYASEGYARHTYYLSLTQLWDAGKLSAISRSLSVLSALGQPRFRLLSLSNESRGRVAGASGCFGLFRSALLSQPASPSCSFTCNVNQYERYGIKA